MPHTDPPTDAGHTLLPLARAAIARALGRPRQADASALWLQQPGACFVTLTQHGELRGCIGSLEARRALWEDVQSNAVAAALHDSRFPPLADGELDHTMIEVSLLSAMRPLGVAGESEALALLHPGVDGVVFEFGMRRSTFLPQVWEQLPEAAAFLAQLKRKAGLPGDFWHADVRLYRYTVAKWAEHGLPSVQPA